MLVPHHELRLRSVGLATYVSNQMDVSKKLLFICSPGTVSAAMIAAIESEFPWLSVATVSDIQTVTLEQDYPVQLILADIAFASVINSSWQDISSVHREAAVALISNSDAETIPSHVNAQTLERVKGIVPYNVNLDVFLSALRIILRGGRYFLMNGTAPQEAPPQGARFSASEMTSSPSVSTHTIDKLTKRENEILARVAMGNQNKIIAAALGLSEHTVKIHIHNIITKLGVHNRTEVVARYFEHSRKDHGHARDTTRRQDDEPFSGNEY